MIRAGSFSLPVITSIFCSLYGAGNWYKLEEWWKSLFRQQRKKCSLRPQGWSVYFARREYQGSNLCPVQKQGVCGGKVVKEFLYFSPTAQFRQFKKSQSIPCLLCCDCEQGGKAVWSQLMSRTPRTIVIKKAQVLENSYLCQYYWQVNFMFKEDNQWSWVSSYVNCVSYMGLFFPPLSESPNIEQI